MDPTTLTLVGGLSVTIIAALAAAIVSVINALRIADVMVKQDADSVRMDTVSKDTEAIKGHVNSEKTAAAGREDALRKENELLREIIADKKSTAGLLAQAAAQRGRDSAPPPNPDPTIFNTPKDT